MKERDNIDRAKIINFERRENRLSEQDMFNLAMGLVKLIRKNTIITMENKYKSEMDRLSNRVEMLLRDNNRLKKQLALIKK